jgi:hypothetical protein
MTVLECQARVDVRWEQKETAELRHHNVKEALQKAIGIRYDLDRKLAEKVRKIAETSAAAFKALADERESAAKPLLSQRQNLKAEADVLEKASRYMEHWILADLELARLDALADEQEAIGLHKGEYGNMLQAYAQQKVDEILAVDPNWKLVPEGPGVQNPNSEKIKLEGKQFLAQHQATKVERGDLFMKIEKLRSENADVLR